MADVTQTPSDVRIIGNEGEQSRVQFGESVVIGDWVYKKASDGKYWKAQHDGTSAEADADGMSLSKSSADGYGYVHEEGTCDVGGTLAVGTTYAISNAAGKICPVADLATGDYVTTVGTATAANTLDVKIQVTGITKA